MEKMIREIYGWYGSFTDLAEGNFDDYSVHQKTLRVSATSATPQHHIHHARKFFRGFETERWHLQTSVAASCAERLILSKGLNQALNRNQNTDVCPFEEDYLVGRLIRGDHRCDDDSDGTNSDDCVDIEPYNIEAKPRQEADGYEYVMGYMARAYRAEDPSMGNFTYENPGGTGRLAGGLIPGAAQHRSIA